MIYTIGHSNYEIDDFISLLKKHSIDAIVDIRNTPYSKRHPQFNKDRLLKILKNENIHYLHFKKEFGLDENKAHLLNSECSLDFDLVINDKQFLDGARRLKKGVEKGLRIALMCAEENPYNCHRFYFVSVGLYLLSFEITHILSTGELLENEILLNRLMKENKKNLQKKLF